MKKIYTYRPYVNIFETEIILLDDDSLPIPEFSTTVPPLPHIDNAVAIIWNKQTNVWEYHEIPLPPLPVRAGYMDEMLSYSKIRSLQYPPQTDYLDAIVKNDTIAIQAYLDACLLVKSRWPKDMSPITRREYFIQVYGMKPYIFH
jgi:hypothetical protein